MTYQAILFDFGGVIGSSPLAGFTAYEREAGLAAGFITGLNTVDPDGNAWACMERGELDEATFFARFEDEARQRGGTLDARALFGRLGVRVRPEMVAAVHALRERYTVACVSNNMKLGHGLAMSASPEAAAEVEAACATFHRVFESRVVGMRKPEVRFYQHVCDALGVAPAACVFLDDLGLNLKPARALGMATIKVGDPAAALRELEAVLGHSI